MRAPALRRSHSFLRFNATVVLSFGAFGVPSEILVLRLVSVSVRVRMFLVFPRAADGEPVCSVM